MTKLNLINKIFPEKLPCYTSDNQIIELLIRRHNLTLAMKSRGYALVDRIGKVWVQTTEGEYGDAWIKATSMLLRKLRRKNNLDYIICKKIY